MKLLFTGANGFLGKNIIPLLREKNFDIITLGRTNCVYNIDLSSQEPFFANNLEVVIHAAGKAHIIPKTAEEIEDFYQINLEGTKNLCKALEKHPPTHFIFISTVAVYGKDFGINISEDSQLLGTTPYAKSKIVAEDFLKEWCGKYEVILTVLRPSLIAGKNPPGNLGAMIKGINSGLYFNIAGGKARKSVVWAEDFAEIIELALRSDGGFFNVCDDFQPSFGEIAMKIANSMNKSEPKNIPFFVAKILASVGDLLGEKAPINTVKLDKITSDLTFSNLKIKQKLGWNPTPVLEKL